MALLKGIGWNDGSLLRRTLLHIGTFALGSLAFIGLMSFLLVTIARSLLPSQTPKTAEGAQKTEATDDADASGKAATPKLVKPKRSRAAANTVVEEESPNREADK